MFVATKCHSNSYNGTHLHSIHLSDDLERKKVGEINLFPHHSVTNVLSDRLANLLHCLSPSTFTLKDYHVPLVVVFQCHSCHSCSLSVLGYHLEIDTDATCIFKCHTWLSLSLALSSSSRNWTTRICVNNVFKLTTESPMNK